jgi:hypothetical protein
MTFDQSAYEAGAWKTALVEDLYERLGLDAKCTPADIQASFHARRKWWEIQEQRLKGHTGHQSPLVQRVGPSIADALKRLQEARDVLGDPRQRANLDFERTKQLEEQWHQRIGALVEIAVTDDRILSLAERRQILRQVADIPRQRAEAIVDQQARAKGARVEGEGRKDPSSATGTGIPPRLAVEPNQFSFVGVKVGEQLRGTCVVSNIGGGVFSGRVSSNRPWLQLENEVLVPSLNRQEIRFSVDTRSLPPGYSDSATIELATSGGTALVPIALSIELREALRARFYSRFMPGTLLLSGLFSILASYFALVHWSPAGLLLLSLIFAWAGAKALCRSVLVYRLGGGTRAGTFTRAAGIAVGSFMLAAVAVGWMSSLSSGPATPRQTVQQAEPTVTVKSSVINVRSGPEVSFITLAKAHSGQQLRAVGRRQDWLAVRWPASSSQLAWVSRAFVRGRDQDLDALPFMAQPVDCQAVSGEWAGAVAGKPATLRIQWRQGRCAGSMLSGGIDESLAVSFVDEDSVLMNGTGYTSAGNAPSVSFSLATFHGRATPPSARGRRRETRSPAILDAALARGPDAEIAGTYKDTAGNAGPWSVRLQQPSGPREELAENVASIDSPPTERSHDSTELDSGAVSTPTDASATVIGGSYKVYPANDALAAAASAMTIDQSGSTFTVRGDGWTGRGTLSGRQGRYDWAYADGHSSGYCDFSVRSDGSLVGQVHGSRVNWSYVAQRTADAPIKSPSEPLGAPPTGQRP